MYGTNRQLVDWSWIKAAMNVFDDAQFCDRRCASVELGYEKRNTGDIPDCDCRTCGSTKTVMLEVETNDNIDNEKMWKSREISDNTT